MLAYTRRQALLSSSCFSIWCSSSRLMFSRLRSVESITIMTNWINREKYFVIIVIVWNYQISILKLMFKVYWLWYSILVLLVRVIFGANKLLFFLCFLYIKGYLALNNLCKSIMLFLVGADKGVLTLHSGVVWILILWQNCSDFSFV